MHLVHLLCLSCERSGENNPATCPHAYLLPSLPVSLSICHLLNLSHLLDLNLKFLFMLYFCDLLKFGLKCSFHEF